MEIGNCGYVHNLRLRTDPQLTGLSRSQVHSKAANLQTISPWKKKIAQNFNEEIITQKPPVGGQFNFAGQGGQFNVALTYKS